MHVSPHSLMFLKEVEMVFTIKQVCQEIKCKLSALRSYQDRIGFTFAHGWVVGWLSLRTTGKIY